MSAINQWSTTAINNSDASPDGAPEGMAPSGVNDTIREIQAQIRAQWNDAQWFDYLDGDKNGTYAYVSSTQFKIVSSPATDLTGVYHIGRRIRVVASTPGTIYGTITASSFSTPDTTVTVSFDSGSLSNEALTVSISILGATNASTVVQDGSAANPSIKFAGDQDSGFFLKSAGEIGLSVGGVERVSFKDDGTLTGPDLGGWENLHLESISTDASVEFSSTELSASTYEQVCFVLKGVLLTSDNTALALQVSTDGGSTWLATSYQYALTGIAAVSPASSIDRQIQSDTEMNLVTAADNSADRGISGHIYWLNPGATTERPVFMWDLTYTHTEASNQIVRIIGSGSHDVSETANAVRFGDTANMGVATVASGTIRAYGLRNA